MYALELLELFAVGLFLLVMVTQVMLPIILKRPMFPFFRYRARAADISNAQDEVDAIRAQREADALRRRAQMMKNEDEDDKQHDTEPPSTPSTGEPDEFDQFNVR